MSTDMNTPIRGGYDPRHPATCNCGRDAAPGLADSIKEHRWRWALEAKEEKLS